MEIVHLNVTCSQLLIIHEVLTFVRILVQICTKLRLNAMSIRTLVQICTKLRSKFPTPNSPRGENLYCAGIGSEVIPSDIS